MPQSKNMARLNEDMKRELIAIVGAMKDPRLQKGLLTITRVEVAQDLSAAKVNVSCMGEGNATAEAVTALRHAAGHVRSEIAKTMHIRKAPEFRFVPDDNAAYAEHINELLAGLDGGAKPQETPADGGGTPQDKV